MAISPLLSNMEVWYIGEGVRLPNGISRAERPESLSPLVPQSLSPCRGPQRAIFARWGG